MPKSMSGGVELRRFAACLVTMAKTFSPISKSLAKTVLERRIRITSYFLGGVVSVFLVASLFFGGGGSSSREDEISYFRETLTPRRDGTLNVELALNLKTERDLLRKGVRRELPKTSVDGVLIEVTLNFCQRNGVDIECKIVEEEDKRFLYLGDGTPLPAGDHTYLATLVIQGLAQDVSEGRYVRWPAVQSSFTTTILAPSVIVDFGVVPTGGDVKGFTFQGEKLLTDNPVQISGGDGLVEVKTLKPLYPSEGFMVDLTWPQT